MPVAPYEITYYGETCEVRLITNVTEVTGSGDEPTRWDYEEYALTVRNRSGLVEDIENGLEAWIAAAKSAEYEKLATELREKRDELLKKSDWTQTVDAPLSAEEITAWQEYRQALRDIPQQEEFPYSITYPIKPE
jgi:hypothetical protein